MVLENKNSVNKNSFDKKKSYRILLLSGFIISLSACGYIYGENGLIKDVTYDYLKAKEEKDLVIPKDLQHQSKANYALIPAIGKQSKNATTGKQLIDAPPTQILDVMDNVRVDTESATEPAVFIAENAQFLWKSLQEFLQSSKIVAKTLDAQGGLLDTGWISYEDDNIWEGIEGEDEVDDFRARYQFIITQGKRSNELRLQSRFIAAEIFNDDSDQWEKADDSNKQSYHQHSIDILNMFLSFYEQQSLQRQVQSTKLLAKFDVELGKNENNQAALIAHAKQEVVWRQLPRVLQKVNFIIDDQDNQLITYFFKYKKDDPGFFASLFGAEKDGIPLETGEYQVVLSELGERTAITFKDAEGKALSDEIVVKLYPKLAKYFGNLQ